MNELNAGVFNIVSLAISLVLLVPGLILWFFVHLASSRANEQVALLEELVDQQKRQNVLLRRLCDANEPAAEKKAAALSTSVKDDEEDDFIRLVAER